VCADLDKGVFGSIMYIHVYVYIIGLIWSSLERKTLQRAERSVGRVCRFRKRTLLVYNVYSYTCMYHRAPFIYMYMGWLRFVGSLKFEVSFAEYRLFYRALLQKRPIILRSLLIVAIP